MGPHPSAGRRALQAQKIDTNCECSFNGLKERQGCTPEASVFTGPCGCISSVRHVRGMAEGWKGQGAMHRRDSLQGHLRVTAVETKVRLLTEKYLLISCVKSSL